MTSIFELKERRDNLIDKINSKLTGIQTSARSTRSEIAHLMKTNPVKFKQFKNCKLK